MRRAVAEGLGGEVVWRCGPFRTTVPMGRQLMRSRAAYHFPGRRAGFLFAASVIAAGLAACGLPSAMGEANSLIIVAPDEVWAQVEGDTYAALERTVYTTRDEKIFNVTHADPGAPELNELLLWRQVLIFGVPDDPLVAAIADAADRSEVVPGDMVQANNVWARGQLATAIVLEPGREIESWRALLPGLSDRLEEQFRAYVLDRMFVSGVDTATADYLRENFGFVLEIPHVYQRVEREGGIVVIRNDNPDPSELIRSILIQRVAPADSVTPLTLYEWRATIDDEQYNVPQDFDTVPGSGRTFELNGVETMEVRGI